MTAMRSWCVALSLLVMAAVARADDGELAPMDAYAPVELVGVMLDTGQCLLWHEEAGEYRVGKIGQLVDGWKIVAIEENRVVMTQGAARDELTLPVDTTTVRPETAHGKLPAIILALEKIVQPKVIEAKVEPKPKDEPKVEPLPKGKNDKTEVKVEPKVEPQKPRDPVKKNVTLKRADVNRELSDFDRVLDALHVEKADGGGFNITYLDDTSWFYKIGLRRGDHVRTIAGVEVSTVDAAARLYAKLGSMNALDVVLDRDGQKVTLKYTIR
jgi:type II secretory pathway component PulC